MGMVREERGEVDRSPSEILRERWGGKWGFLVYIMSWIDERRDVKFVIDNTPLFTASIYNFQNSKKDYERGRVWENQRRNANMDDDENGGLFAIDVGSSDESTKEEDKVPRDFQSQEEFDRQRRFWRPKIETGEVITFLLFYFPLFNCSC